MNLVLFFFIYLKKKKKAIVNDLRGLNFEGGILSLQKPIIFNFHKLGKFGGRGKGGEFHLY